MVNALRSREDLDETVRLAETAGGKAANCLADVTDADAVAKMVSATVDRFGRIDALVNNAALRPERAFGDMSLAEWRRVVSIVLDGAFLCSQACLPHLARAGGGSIVNIGGETGHRGATQRAHAVTAKAGLAGMTKARALVLAVFALAAPAAAQQPAPDYPSRPVKVIVPFSPGGAVDGPMRVIAQELSKRLGQQVIVENRPGAGATIGTEMVAKSPPDGYTLLLASQTNAISATLYPKLPFDPIEDFTPISLVGRESGVLVVNPALPVTTFQDFVAYVKARPGQVDYASSGNGSGQHLFAALLASMTGMKLNHIPYRGSGQATTDLIGGQVSMSIPGTAGMVGHIKAGKLRALAVTGAKRSPQLPDVPTVIESGVPGYEAYVWMGLLAPRGTPAAIVDRIHRELVPVLASIEVRNYMATAGIEIVGSTPAEFGAFFRSEKDRWAKVIHETGAKID